jgi:cytochrome c peroxidase
MKISSIIILSSFFAGLPALAANVIPPPALVPLNQVAVPEPPNLFEFVTSKQTAIRLGKALFWDMQAGSDGIQACGSCHFHAGADNRLKNTVNPGTNAGDTKFQVRGPNDTLQPTDFPFHQRQNPDFQSSPVISDSNDVVGSQGVRLTTFTDIVFGSAVDGGTPLSDAIFNVGGVSMRQVTGRNTPTNINAVFNFSNFWDGRAHFSFNGVNPFGPLDTTAGVWFNRNGTLAKEPVAIHFASLASQATGPPLNEVEMSYKGRTFPQLGRKMLSLTPLGKQLVHPNDSVLGPLSRATLQPNGKITGADGLSVPYQQLIRDAFRSELWDSVVPTPEGFTQMEANFSLFWGLAIQLYEATLVSDQTPFDRFLGGDRTALTPEQQDGFTLFFGAGRCNACHAGSETTNASVTAAAFVTNAGNALIEQMPVASGADIIYDSGFNNTAVRPTTEDIGRGGNSPFTNPLTGRLFPLGFSALAELLAVGNLPFSTPLLPAQLPPNFPVANDGTFKVPGLRNVELTAPYFHNGGMMTLDDVIDFYTRGGNFPAANAAQLDIAIDEIGTLQNSPVKQAALVAFLKSLTDERVRNESAPFDHPEILVPNGDPDFIRIPARDAFGQAAPPLAVAIDPVVSPTRLAGQTVSGTKESGSTVVVRVNDGAPLPPDTATDTTWRIALTGLQEGINTIAVTATDAANVATTISASITVKTAPPVLTVGVATPTRGGSQTISGTVEAGLTPVVNVGTTATVGPVVVSGTSWSCLLSGFAKGANSVTVTAIDALGNVATRTAAITIILPDGDFAGKGSADISDALKALRISLGIVQPSPEDLLHGDVAPMVGGAPAPDGKIDVADALVILRKTIGLVSF